MIFNISILLKLIEESIYSWDIVKRIRKNSFEVTFQQVIDNRDISAIIESLQNRPVLFRASCWIYQFIGKMKVVTIYSSWYNSDNSFILFCIVK